MTQCSVHSLGFLGGREIVGRFDGGRLSSDGGLVLLAQLDRQWGLTERLATCLRDRRQPGKVRQPLRDLFRQRVYQIAAGYEDCNDADRLAGDPMLKLAVGRCPQSDRPLASQPTLSRFENSVSPGDLYRLSEALVEFFIHSGAGGSCHGKGTPRQIVLDLDATDDPTHGQQQLTFFHGYYDEYCYLPLLVFAQADGGEQQIIAAVLRPGNVHAGHRSVAILRRIVAQLRAAWPGVRLVVRGDSGEALPEVYDWCEANGVDYMIGLARNPRLMRLAEPLLQAAREEQRAGQGPVRHCHELSYAADSWPGERRVILKAEVTDRGDNPRFVVTSCAEGSPEELYGFYAERGEMENRIKELNNDLHADRTSCHRFVANQFRLLLHAVAYLLLTLLRAALAGTELACAQVCTLQLRVLKIGVRVEQTARRVWLPEVALQPRASGYPLQGLWLLLGGRVRAGPL